MQRLYSNRENVRSAKNYFGHFFISHRYHGMSSHGNIMLCTALVLLSASAHNTTLDGLSPGSVYNIHVTAINGAGEGTAASTTVLQMATE